MPEEETWDVIGSQVALQHPFLSVTMQNIRLPTGQVIQDWPIVDARSYAMVVAENNAGEILILEGYKHGLGRSSWQVIGGYLEPGEDPLAAAKRELLEEASLTSDFWQILGTFVVDASRYWVPSWWMLIDMLAPPTISWLAMSSPSPGSKATTWSKCPFDGFPRKTPVRRFMMDALALSVPPTPSHWPCYCRKVRHRKPAICRSTEPLQAQTPPSPRPSR